MDINNYTRQTITIKKSTYETLKNLAKADYARRLKIGDVIDALFESLQHGSDQELVFQQKIEQLRINVRPITKTEEKRRLIALLNKKP